MRGVMEMVPKRPWYRACPTVYHPTCWSRHILCTWEMICHSICCFSFLPPEFSVGSGHFKVIQSHTNKKLCFASGTSEAQLSTKCMDKPIKKWKEKPLERSISCFYAARSRILTMIIFSPWIINVYHKNAISRGQTGHSERIPQFYIFT